MRMATNFFQMQQRAKVRTRWALLGFLSCIFLTVTSISLLTGLALMYWQEVKTQSPPTHSGTPGASAQELLKHADGMIAAAVISGFMILVSALMRHMQLAAGPEHVMKALGGWRLPPDTGDPAQRRLRNVVEEMAIASGIPVPEIYILNDPAINACAVGFSVNRAAVGVTHGALATFNRDELQGVIAHEFSHILHGDMRLNTRLISWLAGLFTLSEMGALLMHMGLQFLRAPRRRSSRGNGEAFGVGAILIGCLIWICGAIGLLFGKLLQAIISRQREYLADAAAVQFTRNPQGIGNALRKLGQGGTRGRMSQGESAECAHMMFGNLSRSLTGWMATHPPLHRRIRQVLPDWDGSFLQATPAPPDTAPSVSAQRPPPPPQVQSLTAAGGARLLDHSGGPSKESLSFSRAWLKTLPPAVHRAAHDDAGAQALVYRLLLHKDGEAFRIQRDALMQHEETEILLSLQTLNRDLPSVPPEDRLPLLDLCVPALRGLEPSRKANFAARVAELIAADGQVSLFEFALQQIVTHALETEQDARERVREHAQLRQLMPQVNTLLSTLAHLGADTPDQAAESFQVAAAQLTGEISGHNLSLLPSESCTLADLNQACMRLTELVPAHKERLIRAGLMAVAVDGEIRPGELHAFRAAAAMLNVPVSPYLRLNAVSGNAK